MEKTKTNSKKTTRTEKAKVTKKNETKVAAVKKAAPTKKVTKPTTKTTTKSAAKPAPKAAAKPAPKKTTKKVVKKPEKKTVVKKVAPKKVEKEVKVTPTVEKKVEKVIPEETQNIELEKTIIFDGSELKDLEDVVSNLEENTVVLKDKVVKRKKLNKYIIIVLSLLIFITIVAATVFVVEYQITEKTNNETLNSNILSKVTKNKNDAINDTQEKGEEQYEHIQTITLTEFESKILAGEDMTVLIYSETCYGCLKFEPMIEEELAKQNKKIYRIDITQMSTENINRFRTYYAFHKTPTMFSVDGGIVSSELVGQTEQDNLAEWITNSVK